MVILGIVTAGLLAGMTTTTASSNSGPRPGQRRNRPDQRGPGRNRRRPLSLSVLPTSTTTSSAGLPTLPPAGAATITISQIWDGTAFVPFQPNQCKGMQELTIQVQQPEWPADLVQGDRQGRRRASPEGRFNERSLRKRIHAGRAADRHRDLGHHHRRDRRHHDRHPPVIPAKCGPDCRSPTTPSCSPPTSSLTSRAPAAARPASTPTRIPRRPAVCFAPPGVPTDNMLSITWTTSQPAGSSGSTTARSASEIVRFYRQPGVGSVADGREPRCRA